MTIALLSAALAVVGLAVLWTNPRRFVNQAFSILFFNATAWLILVGFQASAVDRLPWSRANAIVASLGPWSLWLLKAALTAQAGEKRRVYQRSLLWVGIAIVLGPIAFFDSFAQASHWERGPAYALHTIALVVAYASVLIGATRDLRHLSGIQRIEMQFLVVTIGAGALICLVLTAIGNLLQLPAVKLAGLIAILAAQVLAAWAVTFHRIFDIRQTVCQIIYHSSYVIIFTVGFLVLNPLLVEALRSPFDTVLSAGVAAGVALGVHTRTRNWFDLRRERELSALRRAVIDASRAEPNPKRLGEEFERLLRAHWGANFARFVAAKRGSAVGENAVSLDDEVTFITISELGWATPESLQRRRGTPQLNALAAFVRQHQISLLVAVPHGSPAPSLIVALGTKSNDSPYTYPEVQRVQNIAELMDNILTHARLTAEAALKAKMEHLAMMSRGLAHDLKNLITPIASFLVHTQPRLAADGDEAEVHAAAKRSVDLMTDYVREALFFANRLTPKFEPTPIREVLHSAAEITATRARRKLVRLEIMSGREEHATIDRILVQRMLANLLNNAIDASSEGASVTLSASVAASRIRMQVKDAGSGIAAEHRARIFEPYFTTKEFGDDVRGFGLGLTICEKIAQLHGGGIFVDSEPGRGTTITVELSLVPPAPAPEAAQSPSRSASQPRLPMPQPS